MKPMKPEELLEVAERAILEGRPARLSRPAKDGDAVGQEIRLRGNFRATIVHVSGPHTTFEMPGDSLKRLAEARLAGEAARAAQAVRAARPKHSWKVIQKYGDGDRRKCRHCALEKVTRHHAGGGLPSVWWYWKGQEAHPEGRDVNGRTPACPPVLTGTRIWGLNEALVIE